MRYEGTAGSLGPGEPISWSLLSIKLGGRTESASDNGDDDGKMKAYGGSVIISSVNIGSHVGSARKE